MLILYLLSFLVLCCLSGYALRRRLIARLLKLSPPGYSVVVDRAIPVPMPDGVRLLTDHYWPQGDEEFPTILIRTPYGRGREVSLFGGYPMAELPGQRFAERGYHVIIQGVRGRYDSEGEFEPHINEATDGRDTVQWIAEQPWFDGRLAVWGPSYLGYTAWATAVSVSSQLLAIVPVVTSAENYTVTHPNGAFGLESRLRWSQGLALSARMHRQSLVTTLRDRFFGNADEELRTAFMHLPLQDADVAASGRPIQFFREMLDNARADDEYWTERDHSRCVEHLEAPAHLIGGWYDYYLPGLIRDYATLRNAGRDPHLTIGPWHHANAAGLMTGLREGLKWFDIHLKEQEEQRRTKPVRVFIMGVGEWRDLAVYPPPSKPFILYLGRGGSLNEDDPDIASSPSGYTYDPADPTPAFGGALLALRGAGPVDNQQLEARSDVLCFTSAAIEESIVIIGSAKVTLFVRSSQPYTDFHSRLCDVYPDGRSINVCDGLVRLGSDRGHSPHAKVSQIFLELSPTGYCFLPGHRLRLQVSSGAHPRWNRNLGTGEVESTAVSMVTTEQVVYHDQDHPSALQLPRV